MLSKQVVSGFYLKSILGNRFQEQWIKIALIVVNVAKIAINPLNYRAGSSAMFAEMAF
jgi:hypothetical protein